ncbi:RND efflux system, outer membrane lipoprotein, NodT family [Hyphomonas neptunium ATCC 15444]|uniref:RND efflux system, outer membrane lipoprotein, NodT family n=2 Tax=Hyphomonas TaxID=85 RepID=Q0C0D6_HYPNA|nr:MULTISPECIES: TolC family protein [Hyphomonas]ABI78721.1 RND efflux system, outer membrane lipoprotein, NodT family [Hyphomonas neptunium ATCC 15444]KCZ90612.1 RND efflux system outer membrane lipoprotein [Hyphomonas hirschiana VP5]
MIHLKLPTLTAIAALALSACATAPAAPDSSVASRVEGALLSAEAANVAATPVPKDWWRLYQSEALDGLVTQALTNNRSLAGAAANLEQVRAGLSEARSALLPSTTATAGGQYVRDPSFAPGDVETDVYSLGFEMAYEVDIFGRVSSSVEAARQDAAAAEAAYRGASLMVAGETARAWIDYCAGNIQLETAQSNYGLQEETLNLTRTLFDAGRGIRLDVVQAEAALRRAEADIPSVRAARDAALFRLARLTGQTPAEMSQAVPACESMPQLVSLLPTGESATLLARRPDVRQAELQLASAAARVGIATANLYPSVSIGGSVSTASLGGAGDMFSEDGLSFGLGPLISWNFPNVAAARARLAAAEAGVDIALANFDETFLTALEEAEIALTNYAAEKERYAALEASAAASEEAAELARTRYRIGSDNFLNVLDAERTFIETRTALAQSEAAKASAEINVFMAMGGGWAD